MHVKKITLNLTLLISNICDNAKRQTFKIFTIHSFCCVSIYGKTLFMTEGLNKEISSISMLFSHREHVQQINNLPKRGNVEELFSVSRQNLLRQWIFDIYVSCKIALYVECTVYCTVCLIYTLAVGGAVATVQIRYTVKQTTLPT